MEKITNKMEGKVKGKQGRGERGREDWERKVIIDKKNCSE